MHAALAATMAGAFDGPVDEGIEGPRFEPEAGGGMQDVSVEAAAHALLRLVAEHPGRMGRLRASRLIGGYPVAFRDDEKSLDLGRFAVQLDWPLREITRLVDSMISGRLITQTPGPRPVLVLTRAGFRTLQALEAGPTTP
jgi:hypothetical protein